MIKNVCFNHKVHVSYNIDFSRGFLGQIYLLKSYPVNNVLGYVIKYKSRKLILFESSIFFFSYFIYIIIEHRMFRGSFYSYDCYILYDRTYKMLHSNGICLNFLVYDQIE